MRSAFFTADADGKIARAGEGRGCAILPGRPANAPTLRPGSYPVTLVTRTGERIEITGPHAYYWEGSVKFDVYAQPGSSWNVVTFADACERIAPGGRSRITTRVQSATAAGTAMPDGATSGFEVRPGTQSWTAYAAGTLQTARLWVRDLDGVWTDTGEDVDFTGGAVVTRLVDTVGRVYLRAGAGTMTLAIDVTEEVG